MQEGREDEAGDGDGGEESDEVDDGYGKDTGVVQAVQGTSGGQNGEQGEPGLEGCWSWGRRLAVKRLDAPRVAGAPPRRRKLSADRLQGSMRGGGGGCNIPPSLFYRPSSVSVRRMLCDAKSEWTIYFGRGKEEKTC